MSLLEIHGISASYGDVLALHGISLRVEEGEIVTLLGANGAGKTTTLKTISGLLHPMEGEIHFQGRNIARLNPEAIVRLGIAHVPEGRHIFPGLTVKENILLGASNLRGLSRREMEAGVDEMFSIFPELSRFTGTLGWMLSGGQQQMLALARGLMSKPRVLLLDEPSLGLAPLIVQNLFSVIRQIRQRGTTVLLVEQNARMALSVADRGYVLETGKITSEGQAKELWSSEEIQLAYLGGRARSNA